MDAEGSAPLWDALVRNSWMLLPGYFPLGEIIACLCFLAMVSEYRQQEKTEEVIEQQEEQKGVEEVEIVQIEHPSSFWKSRQKQFAQMATWRRMIVYQQQKRLKAQQQTSPYDADDSSSGMDKKAILGANWV